MYKRRHLWPAYRKLLQRSKRPILIGPWRGEVGFEALYWTPFLAAWLQQDGIDPDRCYVITRGGAHCWYPPGRGVELYQMRDPQSVRVENAVQFNTTGMMKQRTVNAWDKAVITDAAKALKLTNYHVLHPSWMYQTLEPWWNGHAGLNDIKDRLAFQKILPPPLPEGLTLPPSFVAVRFYIRSTFPMQDVPVNYARETILQLANSTPVLLLHTDTHADEHLDIPVNHPNVFTPASLGIQVTPQNNLLALSMILGRAKAFVGTYGGLAQLALRYGVPNLSFYYDWQGTALAHRQLADALALQSNTPTVVMRIGDCPFLKSAIPDTVRALATSSAGVQPSPPFQPRVV